MPHLDDSEYVFRLNGSDPTLMPTRLRLEASPLTGAVEVVETIWTDTAPPTGDAPRSYRLPERPHWLRG